MVNFPNPVCVYSAAYHMPRRGSVLMETPKIWFNFRLAITFLRLMAEREGEIMQITLCSEPEEA